MNDEATLIDLLADGDIHSGTEIGAVLGVSRVAVKKRISLLCDRGMPVKAIKGRGYRLEPGADLLSAAQIRSHLSSDTIPEIDAIEVMQQCASTSAYLKGQTLNTEGKIRVVLTECQPEGQGRRGRGWQTTPYKNLMMSIGKRFATWPSNTAAMSLVFAVTVHQAIMSAGADAACIKWPNDILVDGHKLSGLLVDASGEASGGCDLIFGVGVNFCIDQEEGACIDQLWTDLGRVTKANLSRNEMAATIISNLIEALHIYDIEGFTPFQTYWNNHAAYVGEKVRLFNQDATYEGYLRGVNEQGVLTLGGIDDRQYQFTQADISLRPIDKRYASGTERDA